MLKFGDIFPSRNEHMTLNVILQSFDLERSRSSIKIIFTSLAKEVIFLVALVSLSVCSVCLSVCLSVDNITQNVMSGLGRNFMDGS